MGWDVVLEEHNRALRIDAGREQHCYEIERSSVEVYRLVVDRYRMQVDHAEERLSHHLGRGVLPEATAEVAEVLGSRGLDARKDAHARELPSCSRNRRGSGGGGLPQRRLPRRRKGHDQSRMRGAGLMPGRLSTRRHVHVSRSPTERLSRASMTKSRTTFRPRPFLSKSAQVAVSRRSACGSNNVGSICGSTSSCVNAAHTCRVPELVPATSIRRINPAASS